MKAFELKVSSKSFVDQMTSSRALQLEYSRAQRDADWISLGASRDLGGEPVLPPQGVEDVSVEI